jgi:aconitate hydratase
VAYALAGTVDIDLSNEPLGADREGKPVFLKDVWPTAKEVRRTIESAVSPQQFAMQYADVDHGDEQWRAIDVRGGELYDWKDASTYIQHPPFFATMQAEPDPIQSIRDARVLGMFGDSVTTDHISPAGAIKPDSPAGHYLQTKGVAERDFNSYGSRRGNHEVMVRGTFANIRVRNEMAPNTEGGWTTYLGPDCDADPDDTFAPDQGVRHGQVTSIYDGAMAYHQHGVPLIVLAGKDYGMGSSRDWAAKGTDLLGVRAVIAESFERIHRSNLVGMGVLPLVFADGQSRRSLNLTGWETFDIAIGDELRPGQRLTVNAKDEDGNTRSFEVICRVDTPVEVEYYQNGGILHTVLRQLVRS